MKRVWRHKSKYKKMHSFTGSYERDNAGERIFVLQSGSKRIVFESWQAAKKLGWESFRI